MTRLLVCGRAGTGVPKCASAGCAFVCTSRGTGGTGGTLCFFWNVVVRVYRQMHHCGGYHQSARKMDGKRDKEL